MSFLKWIKNEPYTAGLIILLAVLVVLAVRKIIRDRKAGKFSCGGDCGSCAMRNRCHTEDREKPERNSGHTDMRG